MIAVLFAALSLFAQAFGGTWTCTGGTRWHIAPAPGVAWTTVEWGPRSADGGTAYVGYVPKLGAWLYEDFHGDGSYATNTSQGPRGGAWTWSGTYYTSHAILHGSVIWRRTNAGRIDRTFESNVNGVTHDARDSCTRD